MQYICFEKGNDLAHKKMILFQIMSCIYDVYIWLITQYSLMTSVYFWLHFVVNDSEKRKPEDQASKCVGRTPKTF